MSWLDRLLRRLRSGESVDAVMKAAATPIPKERVALALRAAIQRAMTDLESPFENNFVDYVREAEPQIDSVSTIGDPDLACLYNFACYYFFCASHGDEMISGRPAAEVDGEMRDALARLQTGETEMSEWVRRYTEPC